jgi:hypothetical protein
MVPPTDEAWSFQVSLVEMDVLWVHACVMYAKLLYMSFLFGLYDAK